MVTPRIDGIDISHWNSILSWSLVPDFKLISLKATEGFRGRDLTFQSRWKRLRDRGTKYRGAYHWIRSDSSIEAQVKNLTDCVGELQDGEFIQLDWETTAGIHYVTAAQAQEFIDRVNDHYGGIRTIVYSSDWVPNWRKWRDANPTYPYWHANYNLTNPTTGGWVESERYGADVWQWSSTVGVAGFRDGIDVNHVFNWEALDLVSNQLVIPEPEPLIVPQEDPVIYVFIIPQDPEFEFEPGKQGVFTQDGHPVTAEYLDALRAAGAKTSFVSQAPHPWWKEATLHKMGEAARRLYGDTPAS